MAKSRTISLRISEKLYERLRELDSDISDFVREAIRTKIGVTGPDTPARSESKSILGDQGDGRNDTNYE